RIVLLAKQLEIVAELVREVPLLVVLQEIRAVGRVELSVPMAAGLYEDQIFLLQRLVDFLTGILESVPVTFGEEAGLHLVRLIVHRAWDEVLIGPVQRRPSS